MTASCNGDGFHKKSASLPQSLSTVSEAKVMLLAITGV